MLDHLKRQKDTCTACGGTMLLEMAALSRLTGNGIYEEKVCTPVAISHSDESNLWLFRPEKLWISCGASDIELQIWWVLSWTSTLGIGFEEVSGSSCCECLYSFCMILGLLGYSFFLWYVLLCLISLVDSITHTTGGIFGALYHRIHNSHSLWSGTESPLSPIYDTELRLFHILVILLLFVARCASVNRECIGVFCQLHWR